jgi:hypothetical protein
MPINALPPAPTPLLPKVWFPGRSACPTTRPGTPSPGAHAPPGHHPLCTGVRVPRARSHTCCCAWLIPYTVHARTHPPNQPHPRFAALIAMAAYLNQFGFIPWFSGSVVDVVSSLGLSWQPAFGVIVLLYFYSHYFFASGEADRGAGEVAQPLLVALALSVLIPRHWPCIHPDSACVFNAPCCPQVRPTSVRCTRRSWRWRAPAARPACWRPFCWARCPTLWAASQPTASAARRRTLAPATYPRCGVPWRKALLRRLSILPPLPFAYPPTP